MVCKTDFPQKRVFLCISMVIINELKYIMVMHMFSNVTFFSKKLLFYEIFLEYNLAYWENRTFNTSNSEGRWDNDMSNSINSVGPILCCNALRQRPQQTENQFLPQH